MNNKTGFNRLNRRAGHRRALIKNMVTSLFTYERITTTKSKALEVRRHAEKMVTRAKVDSVHNRREIGKTITQNEVLVKLFTVIGPRFQSRAGGYTRILKIGQRFGDAAEMVILEFVERTEKEVASETVDTGKKALKDTEDGKKTVASVSSEKKVPAKKTSTKKSVTK